MTHKTFHKILSKTHKWVGLLLGLQILAWTVGGVVMTWIPIDIVRGEHKIRKQPGASLKINPDFLGVNEVLRVAKQPVRMLAYDTLLGQAIVRVHYQDGSNSVIDARTGKVLTPLNRELVGAIAAADFAPEAPIEAITKLNEHTVDYRGPLPVWQVKFADSGSTSLYVSPDQARVVARRSATWRLFDFFWMLHIMDYDEREDINNPLVMVFAALTALFALSGLGLIYYRFYRRDFDWLIGRRGDERRRD